MRLDSAQCKSNCVSLLVVLGSSTSGQVEAHALLKASTTGCTSAALCNASAMRTSLISYPSSSMQACIFVYVDVAEQGCCQDLLVITSSLHTLLVECAELLIALETQDLSCTYLAHEEV